MRDQEGARYGITYKTNTSGVRIPPNALSPTIQTKVNTYLTNLLPSDANPTVTCGEAGYSAANPSGLPLNVTVSATKKWWLISGLMPSLGSSKILTLLQLCFANKLLTISKKYLLLKQENYMRKLFIIITILLYLQFWCFTYTGSASERVYKPVFINRCGVVLHQLYISKTR